MRKMICALAVIATAGTGCVVFPRRENPKPPQVVQAPKPAIPVTAGQIDERNAGQMAGTLAREIDQEAQGPVIQQTSATTADSPPCKH